MNTNPTDNKRLSDLQSSTLTDTASGLPDSSSSGLSDSRSSGLPDSPRSGLSDSRSSGLPDSSRSGLSDSRSSGLPDSPRSGLSDSRSSGLPDSPRSGLSDSRSSGLPDSPRSGLSDSRSSGLPDPPRSGLSDFPSSRLSDFTPKQLGYYFPAEFNLHIATWLSWPHKEASWPGKIDSIFPQYAQFVKELTKGEIVRINVGSKMMQQFAIMHLENLSVDLSKVEFYVHPTDDAWCRDHGPAFLVNPKADFKKVIVDWGYNAWGNKYPPYDNDDVIPTLIGNIFNTPVFHPGIVMEGGSIEVNGAGTLLTSTCCLLNPNRNPNLSQQEIEDYLLNYYGAEQILWINEGIVGDDTDGHIDDTVRFISADTVLTVIEENKDDENFSLLQKNLAQLQKMRLLNGKQLNIIELPMPDPVIWDDQRLPASYANFYIANRSVIVPTYRCEKDEKALQIIQDCFPDREVVGIDSTDLIWGLGSFHCLSQQEPAI